MALAVGGVLGVGLFHLPADLRWVGEQARSLADRILDPLSPPAQPRG